MNKEYLELYTDYLLSAFGHTTATGLSTVVDGQVSYDQITRFLSGGEYTSKDLWLEVKSTVQKVEREDAVLIFDDIVQEKPYTDERKAMCRHYDHSKGRVVQGFNLLNFLYHVEDISIPVAFELIKKPVEYSDLKTHKRKRASHWRHQRSSRLSPVFFARLGKSCWGMVHGLLGIHLKRTHTIFLANSLTR
jgi:hypothetical protein